MKKRLKFFKFIVNIIAFSSITVSVFAPLWHFQNTKNHSDFKVQTRDLNIPNSKKLVNFKDLVQITSTTNEQNSLIINANIEKNGIQINKTSTKSDVPNFDDIKIKINQNGDVILNSLSLEIVNKKAILYFEDGKPKLKFENHIVDFEELLKPTRVEKTLFFLLPFIPFIAKAVAAVVATVAVTTVAVKMPNIVSDIGRWIDSGTRSRYESNNSEIISKTESSIVVDLDSLPREEGESKIRTKEKTESKAKAKAKANVITLSIVKDKKSLQKYKGIHLAWFFNFHDKDLTPHFVISEQEISETQAWALAVGSLLAQSKLTQIVIDNLLPSSIKNNIGKKKNDRKNMNLKLNSPVDFYSNNRLVMRTLAEKTRDTANFILGNSRSISNDNNLNKNHHFSKSHFVVGNGLARDPIDWTKPENVFFIPDPKSKQNKEYQNVFFPSFHVRRLIFKDSWVHRDEMLNVEKVHFLYGDPHRFNV
ncbi:hypothetical protein [Mesomycoplasma dispar]|uniref:Uncharacterized protein n=1 Tax=Mesomycoplasma dispar TaxID=86660 RepID=A0ABM6PQS5_9BACT|nr:hypothetical protein [Mesomycoplasma dispar]ATP59538.1 hypothetical protein CSW10_01050 [Mesomycoplasma dispar]